MNAKDALTEFNAFIETKGESIGQLSPSEATKLMIDFYSTVRADNCEIEADGDMLLFQWGIYDWGSGKKFEYNITRQFIFPAKSEDDDEECEEDTIWQLSLTLKFQPLDKFEGLKGNQWCASPDEVPEFGKFIESHESTKLATEERPIVVELKFNQQ